MDYYYYYYCFALHQSFVWFGSVWLGLGQLASWPAGRHNGHSERLMQWPSNTRMRKRRRRRREKAWSNVCWFGFFISVTNSNAFEQFAASFPIRKSNVSKKLKCVFVCLSAFKNQECYYCLISFLFFFCLKISYRFAVTISQQMFVVFCGIDKIRNRQKCERTKHKYTQLKCRHRWDTPLEMEVKQKTRMPLIARMCASLWLITGHSIWPS